MQQRNQELARYVRFSAKDAASVASFASRATPHFSRIAQEFYERIREHEEAHKLFTGEDQIARLQRSMVIWLERLFSGTYDDAYFARTEQVGRVHVQVGLPQRYMPLAMTLIRSSLTKIIHAETPDAATALAIADAVSRLLDLELTVMLESYHTHLANRIDRQRVLDEEEKSERESLSAGRRRATFAEEASVRAIEVAPLLVIGLSSDGMVTLFNRYAEELSGYAQDEVLGRPFASLFLPADSPDPESGHTLPFLLRSGRERHIRWEIARLPSSASYLFGFDMTDMLVTVERQNHERRAAALGNLAAGLAHEIRNPLNGAKLHASFLERALTKPASFKTDDALDTIRVVNSEIQRLAHLVTDFLDYAQPQPLSVSEDTVQALCERAIHSFRTTNVIPEGIMVGTDLPSTDVIVRADMRRLEQALQNLLDNALESVSSGRREGGGGSSSSKIILRARREPRAVWIEVEDDGPGFASDKPIFDAFFSTKAIGTGLGLPIVHRIVTDHGGTIDASSGATGHTRFRVRLPLPLDQVGEQR